MCQASRRGPGASRVWTSREREETVDHTPGAHVWRQEWDKGKADQAKGLGVFEGPEKTQRPPA